MADTPTTLMSFPFLRLPYEIQEHICCQLCTHCRNEGIPLYSWTIFEDGGLTALKELCLTSRAMRHLAQPILFHAADTTSHKELIRSLIERPDLAKYMKVAANCKMRWVFQPWPIGPAETDADLDDFRQLADTLGFGDDKDPNYDLCFEWYLNQEQNAYRDGWNARRGYMAIDNLLTTMYFSLLPNLEIAAIDLNDGRWPYRRSYSPYTYGPSLEYHYLPQYLQKHPTKLSNLKSIVFRHAQQATPDDLGLRRLHFLFKYIPNVRCVIFDWATSLHTGSFDDTIPLHPELDWEALPELHELHFYPCNHTGETLPLIGIERLIKRCKKLRRFRLHLAAYCQSTAESSFSPTRMIECLATASETLTHFSLACSYLLIHNLAPYTLLGSNMSMFTRLTNLDVEEQVFCHHWLDTAEPATCIINMLPTTVTTLTVRLHDKFRAIGDVCRLGTAICNGGFPALTSLHVIVQYPIGTRWRIIDLEHYFADDQSWEKMIVDLKILHSRVARDVTEAFCGAKMLVSVTLEERNYRPNGQYYITE